MLGLFPPQEDDAMQISESEAKPNEALQWNQRKHTDMRKKNDYFPAYQAIRALITDPDALSQCFIRSGEIRDTVLRIFYSVVSQEDSAPPAQPLANKALEAPSSRVHSPAKASIPTQRAAVRHLETNWSGLVSSC